VNICGWYMLVWCSVLHRGKRFCFSLEFPDCSVTYPAFCSMGTGAVRVAVKWPGCEVDYSPPSHTGLRMQGGIPVLPVCAFMVWTGTTLTLHLLMIKYRLYVHFIGHNFRVKKVSRSAALLL